MKLSRRKDGTSEATRGTPALSMNHCIAPLEPGSRRLQPASVAERHSSPDGVELTRFRGHSPLWGRSPRCRRVDRRIHRSSGNGSSNCAEERTPESLAEHSSRRPDIRNWLAQPIVTPGTPGWPHDRRRGLRRLRGNKTLPRRREIQKTAGLVCQGTGSIRPRIEFVTAHRPPVPRHACRVLGVSPTGTMRGGAALSAHTRPTSPGRQIRRSYALADLRSPRDADWRPRASASAASACPPHARRGRAGREPRSSGARHAEIGRHPRA